MSEEKQQKLQGIKRDFFEDRFLKVGVSLNKERAVMKSVTEKESTHKKPLREPTLVELIPVEGRQLYIENIVFLYEDSHISFTLTSKGPCGYGFKIFTMEKNIVNRLYAGNEGDEKERTVQISRYQNDASSIRVKDFDYFLNKENNINDNILKRSLVSIITWPIFGYEQNFQKYRPGVPKVSVDHKKSRYPKNKDLGKYFKSKDFKKYLKNISIQGGDFSRRAVESPINDSNCIVKGPNSKERFNERIANIVEDNDKSNLKTNGSIHMLFYILEPYQSVEDLFDLEEDNDLKIKK